MLELLINIVFKIEYKFIDAAYKKINRMEMRTKFEYGKAVGFNLEVRKDLNINSKSSRWRYLWLASILENESQILAILL